MDIIAFFDVLELYPATVAAFAAVIAAISIIIAVWSNLQSRGQYKDSIQPQLSMSLLERSGLLFLKIENTGSLSAKNAKIIVKRIRNNGTRNELMLDGLFGMSFELHARENVQGCVAIYGADISNSAFPQIDIDVEYSYKGRICKVKYSRTVTYTGLRDEKSCDEKNLENNERNQALRTTARAAVRIANYLDGHQVTSIDELEILAKRSLKRDLESLGGKEDKTVFSREETINEALKNRMESSRNDPSTNRITVKYRKKRD